MLLGILIGVALVFVFALGLYSTRQDGPRCACGRLGAYMLSDGSWECDECREARLGARAPKGG